MVQAVARADATGCREVVAGATERRVAEIARIFRDAGNPDDVGYIQVGTVGGAEEFVLEKAVPAQPQLVHQGRRKNVRVGEAQVLCPSAIATRVETECRNGIVRLSVEHVAAIKAVSVREAVIDARDILILIDRS